MNESTIGDKAGLPIDTVYDFIPVCIDTIAKNEGSHVIQQSF